MLGIVPELLPQPSSLQQWWLSPTLTFQRLLWKRDGTDIQLMSACTLLQEEAQEQLGSRSYHVPGEGGVLSHIVSFCAAGQKSKESRGSTVKCCTWGVNQKPEQMQQQSLERIKCKRDRSVQAIWKGWFWGRTTFRRQWLLQRGTVMQLKKAGQSHSN